MSENPKYLDLQKILDSKAKFVNADPFPHLILDEFLSQSMAKSLAAEFPSTSDKRLFVYDNALEHKLALNDWNAYPSNTYQFIQYLNSEKVIDAFSEMVGVQLYPDHGLHGGGWHMHSRGGKLNPHLDYSIHPKLGLQRKLNLIIYFAEEWNSDWGGHLGFWSHDENKSQPKQLIKEIEIKFNRVVLFDTTCNSWHGITRPLSCPKGHSRNSIAIYYLAKPSADAPSRSRALYAPTTEQQGDKDVLDLIKKSRSRKI